MKPPDTSDKSCSIINHIGLRTRIKFDGQCLKQDEVTFNHKTVANICNVNEIKLWPFKQIADFTLGC